MSSISNTTNAASSQSGPITPESEKYTRHHPNSGSWHRDVLTYVGTPLIILGLGLGSACCRQYYASGARDTGVNLANRPLLEEAKPSSGEKQVLSRGASSKKGKPREKMPLR